MMYSLSGPVLSLQDVSLAFGDKKILRSINLEIHDIVCTESMGQVITLLGKSGIGKTQLMKVIGGLQKPTTGTIKVGLNQVPVEPGMVGMVLQTYPLFAHRTVLSNLNLVSSDKARIEEYLNEFDIWAHKDKYPNQLSGGQRQRTAIVQQLLCSSHMILLDEPFSGLDPVATEKLCRNISKVANHDSENTVIISSHILEPSLAISDEVVILGNEYTITEAGERACVEGATIVQKFDLASEGLAWDPNVRRNPKFTELVEHIREIFQKL